MYVIWKRLRVTEGSIIAFNPEFVKNNINRLIQKVDSVEKLFDLQLQDINDQDTLNKIHAVFENNHGKLDEWKLNPLFKNKPNDFRKNLSEINLKKDEFIFHAGTKEFDNKIFSNGGRVLNFVVKSENFKKSRDRAINLIDQINWDGGFYRKDIGFKIIDKWES